MKKLLIILFLGLFVCKPGFSQEAKALEKAYKHKSQKELQSFFNDWASKIKPVTNAELAIMNDTIRQAYAIFNTFYQPFDIGKLGGSEWGGDIYKKSKFLIVQNNIDVYFKDKLVFTDAELDSVITYRIKNAELGDSLKKALLTKKDGKLRADVIARYHPDNLNLLTLSIDTDNFAFTLKDFRPKVNGKGRSTVFLTSTYKALLNSFLKNNYSPLGAGGLMNPARARGESAKRQKFLENFVKIWQGHWGGYWQLYSYPTVGKITFDKNLTYAKVYFTMVYEGGQALLKREGNKWVLLRAERTWIE